jgi:hypothetical protein
VRHAARFGSAARGEAAADIANRNTLKPLVRPSAARDALYAF